MLKTFVTCNYANDTSHITRHEKSKIAKKCKNVSVYIIIPIYLKKKKKTGKHK